MRLFCQRVWTMAIAITLLCLSESRALDVKPPAPSPAKTQTQPAETKGKDAPRFELPLGIEEMVGADGMIAGPTWPLMPLKRRLIPTEPASGGPVVQGLQLIAEPEKYEVEALEPIVVRVTVRNTTKQEIEFPLAGVEEKTFLAEVKDSADRIVPLTAYGKVLDPSDPARLPYSKYSWGRGPLKLKAHREASFPVVINQITDMSLSGSYFVTIRSSYLKALVSNPIQIDVFPRGQLPKRSEPNPTDTDRYELRYYRGGMFIENQEPKIVAQIKVGSQFLATRPLSIPASVDLPPGATREILYAASGVLHPPKDGKYRLDFTVLSGETTRPNRTYGSTPYILELDKPYMHCYTSQCDTVVLSRVKNEEKKP